MMTTLLEEYEIGTQQLLPHDLGGNDIYWGILHAAACHNARKCLEEIMKGTFGPPDVEQKDGWFGSRPLGWAAYSGHVSLCKLLMSKYRASKTAVNNDGQTAWTFVADKNNAKWINVFLDRESWLQQCKELGLQPIFPEESPATPTIGSSMQPSAQHGWFTRTKDLALQDGATIVRDTDLTPEAATNSDSWSTDSNAPGLQQLVGDLVMKMSVQKRPIAERLRARLIGDVCVFAESWQRDLYPMDPVRGRTIAVPAGVKNVKLRVYPFERSPFDHFVVFPLYRECKMRVNRAEVTPHQKLHDSDDRPAMNPEGILLDKACYHVNLENLTTGQNVVEIMVSDRILVKSNEQWSVFWTRDWFHVNLMVGAADLVREEKPFKVEPFMFQWAQGTLPKDKAVAIWVAQARAIGWPLDKPFENQP